MVFGVRVEWALTSGRNQWVGAFFQAMWWLDGVGVMAGRGVCASLHRVQYFTS